MSEVSEIIERLTKQFTDEGKLVEAGFQAYRMLAVPPNAPDIQVKECRLAYFFGAQHLYASMMGILDDGDEPTEEDIKRMELIHKELEAFIEDVKRNT